MKVGSPECGCACVRGPGAGLVGTRVDTPMPLVHGLRVSSAGVTQFCTHTSGTYLLEFVQLRMLSFLGGVVNRTGEIYYLKVFPFVFFTMWFQG